MRREFGSWKVCSSQVRTADISDAVHPAGDINDTSSGSKYQLQMTQLACGKLLIDPHMSMAGFGVDSSAWKPLD